jgi:glycosyltransferase involved in cell wall biosynthesis
MDETQRNHLKAYGIAYYALEREVEVTWLLNYRGGAFMMKYADALERQAKLRGVSIEVIADIIEAHKNTIVFNQENQGLSMVRNNRMAIANGEYLLRLDSDDLLIEGSLNPLLQTALESKADMVVADFVKMNDQEIAAGPLPKYPATSHLEETNGYQLCQNDFTHNTYVWHTLHRTEFIRQNNYTINLGSH